MRNNTINNKNILIKLDNFWTILSSRKTAKKVFHIAQEYNFQVIFDFEGIDFLNTSFADELFAKAVEQGERNFKIKNVKDEFMQSTIKFVINGRLKDKNK